MNSRGWLKTNMPWLVLVMAPVIVFLPALLNMMLLAPLDGYMLNIPWYEMTARSWRHGILPAWNPFSFGGTAILSMQQAGVFSPSVLLFVLLPVSLAANVNVISAFVIAAVGAALLAKCFVES